MDYWLISAPGEKTCQQTWETLNSVTCKQNDLCRNYKFHIPDLKVGTLDQLVGLSDDLAKLDQYSEGVTRKLASTIADTLEQGRSAAAMGENLQAANQDLGNYITHFAWDSAKYPTKQSLKSLHDIINKQMGQIDSDLKTKSAAYQSLKGSLQAIERKQTGSLLSRQLTDLVKREHFVLGSEYLTTLLVVVPKPLYKEWELTYENLANMIVPRSSCRIFEDAEHGLYSVTLFQKVVDEFRQNAREHKFYVREFEYNEEEITAGKSEMAKLESDKKRQYQILLRWLKVNFSESFIAWIHVKALRVFVESVLRYGLPVNFQAVLIYPHRGKQRKLMETLNTLYRHLDTSIGHGPSGDMENIPGLGMGTQDEYYPYVFFKVNLDLIS